MLAEEGTLQPTYDVIVVGSGYGGAIAASRFARAGQSVCVLERGSERWPGSYPETLRAAVRNSQLQTEKRHYGSRTALFDIRFDDEVNVLVGCGLGGTSLINANVALRPIPEVFDDRRWPEALRGDNKHDLERYFALAEQWLGSNAYPDAAPRLAKLDALNTVADHLGAPLRRAPVNVTFGEAINAAGVSQPACNGCGNCVSGCNVGAKNTVLMNYLPDAVQHGAAIFTERSVDSVSHAPVGGRRWEVTFHEVASGRRFFDAARQTVQADLVVLAAGTLGSTEILLRSRAKGLTMSDQLGERFNGNGDVLGFGYDSDQDVNAIGWTGPMAAAKQQTHPPVGPTISGAVFVNDASAERATDGTTPGLGRDDLVIEEGAIPGMLDRILPLTLLFTALTASNAPWREKIRMILRSWRRAARHTLTYLVMSNDDASGRLELVGDRVAVNWPEGPKDIYVKRNNALLEKVSPAIGAQYAPELWYTAASGHQLITVHPLGGCVMADTAESGVVNDHCEVFSGRTGTETHAGLHVMDGSVLPRPVDTNPSLTISALTERAVDKIAAERGWPLDVSDATAPIDAALQVAGRTNGVVFTERMVGWLGLDADDYESGVRRGQADASPFSFVLTIAIADVDALANDPSSVHRFTGTVDAPRLSTEPLMVSDGEFRLLGRVASSAEEWNMSYRMRLTTTEGRAFRFEGHKVVKTGSMLRGWKDTTTLFITLSEDANEGAIDSPPVIGRGVLRITVPDLLRQLWTIDAPGVGLIRRQRIKYRFARAFTGAFLPIYGGLLAEGDRADHQPFSGLRALRLPTAAVSVFSPSLGWKTLEREAQREAERSAPEQLRANGSPILTNAPGDAELMLTRFQGGEKGPVLLAAGFSMRANSFAEPTTKTTLTEALVEAGYDVWLFDYRASIALPSSRTSFTIDDIATLDWPRAVAEVRRQTGAESVQVFGHCVGSVSIMMALLAGLEGVRSAVCSQFTVYTETSKLNRFKNAIRAVELFHLLGIRRLEPSIGRTFRDRATDLAAGLLPVPDGEACQVPVCRWLNAIFGLTHTHDQINAATHESFTAAFGVGEVRPLRHLGLMLRKGRALDHRGQDVYLPNVERLAVPTLFLQGERNYIFKPGGMAKTLAWLRRHHDDSLFELLHLEEYAHLDGIVGTNAATDVYPSVIAHLDRFNAPTSGRSSATG